MIHLAFIVNPIHDEDKMGRINLQGALNFLEAARRCAPERVLVSSYANVYGAWPDNPVPLPEEVPPQAAAQVSLLRPTRPLSNTHWRLLPLSSPKSW